MSNIQQIKIVSLDTKIVEIKGRSTEKWIVNDQWESIKGRWNSDWKIGGYAKGLFIEKSYGNQTYYNIACPPEWKKGATETGSNAAILNKLEEIHKDVILIKHKLYEDDNDDDDNDEDDVGDVDDLPYGAPEDAPITKPGGASRPIPESVEDEIRPEDVKL